MFFDVPFKNLINKTEKKKKKTWAKNINEQKSQFKKARLSIKAMFNGAVTGTVKCIQVGRTEGHMGVFTRCDRRVAVATHEVKVEVTLQAAGTAAGHLTPLYQARNKTTGLFHLHPLILTLTCV